MFNFAANFTNKKETMYNFDAVTKIIEVDIKNI